ncbi:DUF4920 domain-containing protein [Tahibacter soli]|uniref:DUF4920 domain-containing protein n=1 Tax=Tahibacter soli TaxID=2983605 RepID=A0A9X4BJP9_9GAMM|nr:DUF4920 domain-containing protein [Tahibacter soli]MDC8014908.1 DUF4920 domain-containing protein [Tahibacter soli]
MKRGFLFSMLAATALVAGGAYAHDDHAHGDKSEEKPGCDPKVTAKATETGKSGSTYGQPMPASLTAVSIADVAADPAKVGDAPRAFSGRITDVCQMQGCWMVLEHQGSFARVVMHDHAFSVPKDAKGDAVVYGTLKVKTLSDAEVEHLSKEGRTPASKTELTIDATSVRIGQG